MRGGGNDITELSTDLLSVLTTDEKRAALGYAPADGNGNNETILASTLGVGGTQSLVEIVQSDSLGDEEKRGLLEVLFGLDKEQIDKII